MADRIVNLKSQIIYEQIYDYLTKANNSLYLCSDMTDSIALKEQIIKTIKELEKAKKINKEILDNYVRS